MGRTMTNSYAEGQHKLICDMLGVSEDSSAPGSSAYEAVCVMRMKLEEARRVLAGQKSIRVSREAVDFINKPMNKFGVVQVTWEKPQNRL